MRVRLSAEERRLQIARVALGLLAELPVERLSTRRVAKAAGLTQPALFKHFRSRDAILSAVLTLVRQELQGLVHELLASGTHGRAALRQLLEALGGFVAARPGVPRLLFHELAARERHGEPGALRAPLLHLAAMQRALFGELVRGAQQREELPEGLDPGAAARSLLALARGRILAWQFGEEADPLPEALGRDLELLWTAWEHGVPAQSAGPAAAETTPLRQPLLRLDVRPRIAAGEDPLAEILALVDVLAADGLLQLLAPFRPVPLLQLLGSRGLVCTATEPTPGAYEILVRGPAAPAPLDLRELPAPEPLEAVLRARAALQAGACLLARLPRRPELLLQRLSEFGDDWNLLELDDGSAILHVTRAKR